MVQMMEKQKVAQKAAQTVATTVTMMAELSVDKLV